MDPQENTGPNMETTTIEWELCSPYFEDIIIIVPRDLNSIPITSQYEEILAKQVQKRYFEVDHCKSQHAKGR